MQGQISAVLLAGGTGQRMGGTIPKQYLTLNSRPLILHSLDILLTHPEIHDVVVVCDPSYRDIFHNYPVRFALPGKRRQDSLYNGVQEVNSQWVCVHDAARPFISPVLLSRLFSIGKEVGAATLGIPMKATVKEIDKEGLVAKTLNRNNIWEIQTPQFLLRDLLNRGFSFADTENCEVTDDVSLAELIGHPVRIVEGCQRNLKITTPDDLRYAEWLSSQGA